MTIQVYYTQNKNIALSKRLLGLYPSGLKSGFFALTSENYIAIALLFRDNFPASGQKIHLFNLQKQNPNKL